MGASRGRSADELKALFDEIAEIDWGSPAWRAFVASLAAAEARRGGAFDPDEAVEAFTTALRAESSPVADTFMATHGPRPPADRAGRIALAARRAVATARTLTRHDHTAPGQRLRKVLRRRGGWLEDEVIAAADGRVPIAFVANGACFVAEVAPDDPGVEATLAAALTRALEGDGGLAVVDPKASSPTPAPAAVSVEPVSQTWARSFHRAAWTRGGGPWMGVADSAPYEVVSTCHCAIDGYAHARIASEVLRPSALGPAHLAPDPFAGVPGVEPPPVGFASRVIASPTPRFAQALHAFGTVLDRHLGDGGSRSVPFHVPVAPGRPVEAARWRRRPLYGVISLRREAGELETADALRARLPEFLARESSGGGLLTRTLLAILAFPLPDRLRRALIAGHRMDEWFPPARMLSGRGYLSWMRFPAGEQPTIPTFPSAIPSFSVSGDGGCGLSIAPFTDGLAVGLTTSGSIGHSAFAEQFLDEWVEALPPAVRGSAWTA